MNWFYNLKTATKLMLCFGIMIAGMLSVAITGNLTADTTKSNQDATYKVDLRTLDLAHELQIARLKVGRDYRDGIIFTDPAKVQDAKRRLDMDDKQTRALFDEIDTVVVDEASRRSLTEAKHAYDGFAAKAHEAIDNSPIGDSKGDPPRMMAAMDQTIVMGKEIDERIANVTDQARRSAKSRAEASEAQFNRNQRLVTFQVLLVLCITILSTFIISRAIANPLRRAVSVLDTVSQGDLTARLSHDFKDEVGHLATALNASLEAMQSTLANAQSISIEVSAAATQLAASAQQISGGAQEQAASLEETAASLEEISSTVKQNTDNAQQASQLATGARDAAEHGGHVVESAVAAMNEITKSSKKIADIITTIDEIAFQTNLLALNAAVEAARAGEQGRGFGVVAAEVRSLAQRTATAAKEIRGLIADSSSKVEAGTFKVNQSGETLEDIVKSVKRVTDMVAEIAAASREQTTGIEQVNTAVTQVDQVTQLNAAQTEELSATASSLSEKANELRERISRFELGTDVQLRVVGKPAPAPTSTKKVTPIHAARTAVASPPAQKFGKVANGYEEF